MKSEQLRKGFALTPKNKKAEAQLLPFLLYWMLYAFFFLERMMLTRIPRIRAVAIDVI